ncbi:protein kinase [Rhizobium sp. P40RR-XXII]|uniref:protein kinase domain-containing protein n=1 Tax=unclassified Rhizobium TaxID=2613769 RepID=UPI001456B5E8|nr:MULTISPECIES: protein kinase [unclassified Rhizobium]NLR89266.1 protein kinase [Rhizobium sp. P28RR-XV]NLS20128.1 protein kinase [Rhizobium sp. P40RR-XXII]
MKEIATRFAELLHLITHDGETERPKTMSDLLADRLRDALDRRLPSIADDQPSFVANTFLVEAVVHRNERTEISRLRHRDLGTRHALKTISAERADEAVTKALLLREARIGMTLCHVHLAAVQCAIRLADGRPAIIAEWAGPSLPQRLAASSISLGDVRAAMRSLLAGLNAIHAAGFVHGDISPANLLLCEDDFRRLKITDFGTTIEYGARYRDLDIAKAATAGFSAPELLRDPGADPRADLYSAGCVMKLLLDHCDEADETVARLTAVAQHLADQSPSSRPPSATAAIALIDEV